MLSRTAKLQAIWECLNAEHFGGKLQPVPIRITRSRRTYGYFNAPNSGGRPSIRISTVLADTEDLVRETLTHEMIHQDLYELGSPYWALHDDDFQRIHVEIFGHAYVEPD